MDNNVSVETDPLPTPYDTIDVTGLPENSESSLLKEAEIDILKEWSTILSHDYIRGKIVDSQLAGKLNTRLIQELPLRKEIDYRALYKTRVPLDGYSTKEKIEHSIDLRYFVVYDCFTDSTPMSYEIWLCWAPSFNYPCCIIG